MNITITGASGMIGRRLLKHLMNAGHKVTVLSRHAGTNMPAGVKVSVWEGVALPPEEALRDADAVIHLAGEPLVQRWSAEAKRRIHDSRVVSTRNLVAAMTKLAKKPAVLVNSSAIGYYGSRGDEVLDEGSAAGRGFLPDLCAEWEKEARAAEGLGIRVVCMRTGIALDARGGALKKMLPPFKMGAGGRLGDGRQWMSWIHVEDLVSLFRFAMETESVRGPINGVAPNPVTNADFTKALGSAVHRPAIFPVPSFGLKMLFGEMSEVLLDSQRVTPKAAEAAGFRFRFPQLDGALKDLLG
jgi:uncharacterized protein (TIGR01777 family)